MLFLQSPLVRLSLHAPHFLIASHIAFDAPRRITNLHNSHHTRYMCCTWYLLRPCELRREVQRTSFFASLATRSARGALLDLTAHHKPLRLFPLIRVGGIGQTACLQYSHQGPSFTQQHEAAWRLGSWEEGGSSPPPQPELLLKAAWGGDVHAALRVAMPRLGEGGEEGQRLGERALTRAQLALSLQLGRAPREGCHITEPLVRALALCATALEAIGASPACHGERTRWLPIRGWDRLDRSALDKWRAWQIKR